MLSLFAVLAGSAMIYAFTEIFDSHDDDDQTSSYTPSHEDDTEVHTHGGAVADRIWGNDGDDTLAGFGAATM